MSKAPRADPTITSSSGSHSFHELTTLIFWPSASFSDIFYECSFPDDLHQHSLPPPTVELSVKNIFPLPEIQSPFSDGNHDLAPHQLPLHVCVNNVCPNSVFKAWVDRNDRGQTLQPHFVVAVQTLFVVIDEYCGCHVHRVYKREPFPDTTLTKALLYLRRDVNKGAAGGYL